MKLAFDRRGRGPLVLLLHGIGSHKEIWDPIVDRLVLGGREESEQNRAKHAIGHVADSQGKQELIMLPDAEYQDNNQERETQ